MPDRSQIARLENLEGRAGLAAKTHIVWISDGDDPDPTAAINRLIEKGRAKAGDRFLTAAWKETGGPEAPMADAVDPFGAGPRLPPPADRTAWSPGVALDLPSAQPPPWNDNFGGRISYFDGPWD